MTGMTVETNLIALAATVPMIVPPQRLRADVVGVKSAVARPFEVDDVDWSAGCGSILSSLKNGEFLAGVSRSPLTASVRWTPNPTNLTCQYYAIFYNPDNNRQDTQTGVDDLGVQYPLVPLWFENANPGDPTKFDLHGDTFFPIDFAGRKGFHISSVDSDDLGTIFNLRVYDAIADVIDRQLCIYRLNGTSWELVNQQFLTDVAPFGEGHYNTAFIFHTTGYYAMAYVSTHANDTARHVNISMDFMVRTDAWGFLPIPHLVGVQDNIRALRVNAVSVMLTPHAPFMYEGGQVVGVQLGQNQRWDTVLGSSSPLQTLAKIDNSCMLDLAKGIYGYMRMSDLTTSVYDTPFEIQEDYVVGTTNPLYPAGGWLLIAATAAKIGSEDSIAYPGAACHMTTVHGIEFQTNNTWFDSEMCTMSEDAAKHAYQLIATVPQWHENPLHIREILNSIRAGTKRALAIAPTLLQALSAIVPGFSAVSGLAGVLQGVGRLI